MARTAILSVSVLLALVLTGCGDSQKRLMVAEPGPALFEKMTPSATAEVAMVEDLAKKRQAYRKKLEELKDYYLQAGNLMKLGWVDKELNSLKSAPRYRYIIQAEIAGPGLSATETIVGADRLFDRAVQLYNDATIIPLYTDKQKMRLALADFNRLIKEYPASDKIDDAAFLAGRIHEHFKDYQIAVLYYKRCYQWNPKNPYPARYRAARILDYKLIERSEALGLYQASLKKERHTDEQRQAIQKRIKELTTPPGIEDIK